MENQQNTKRFGRNVISSIPIQCMPDSQVETFGALVLAAAGDISRRLGAPKENS
jgi:hypothetical protein